MKKEEETILIIGATGNIGSELVKQLVEKNKKVRVFTRDPAKAKMKFGAPVEIVEGDLSKPKTLDTAFVGVDKAFVLSPVLGPEFPDLEGNAYNAAKKAGVKHIVNISGISGMVEDYFSSTPFAKWHLESEKRLQNLGVAWTILRPSFFASNLIEFGIALRGGLFLPTGNGKTSPIDPHDIAAVAAEALTTTGHEGKIYALSGPESISFSELVERVSSVTGKPLKFVDVPEAAWRQEMLNAGAPIPVVESLVTYFAVGIKAGHIDYTTSTVTELLGRPARTIEQWAKDHIAELQ